MNKTVQLTASQENYLKAIYYIVKEQKAARVKDISKYLNIGASSVSEALKPLADKGVINYQPYGIATLTEKGEAFVQEIISRHAVIKNFFENVLSVSPELAEESASKVEYSMPEEVMQKFVRFLTFMETCSCKEPKWIKSYKHYSANEKLSNKCLNCIEAKKSNPSLNNSNCCGMNS